MKSVFKVSDNVMKSVPPVLDYIRESATPLGHTPDFLVQLGDTILPIEVKAGENLRSKSLRTFVSAHPPTHGIRFSLSPYREQEWMTNVPLYGVGAFLRQHLRGTAS